jgi:Sporulation and spore germination
MTLSILRLGPRAAALGLGLALLSLPTATAAPASERIGTPTLTSVSARHVGDVDRVTFGFSNGLPAHVYPQWKDRLVYDGSGLPVRVAGAKVLALGFTSATGHDQSGFTFPSRTAYALPNVITSVYGGDFEGYVTVGLGVQKRTSYTVTRLHDPDRVVVDVRADFPTTTRKIWLADSDATFVSRSRPVPTDAPAAGALHALFAGPTQQERAAGLRLVRSGAWGFADLSIAGGVARVRLTRGCHSGGSTTTVAGEIAPTLRQFPTVDWVKILDPRGHTELPTGSVDSIPACLEP